MRSEVDNQQTGATIRERGTCREYDNIPTILM